MDIFPVPRPAAAGAALAANAEMQRSADDEVPLGWECANPALQIERWGMDEPGADLSGKS